MEYIGITVYLIFLIALLWPEEIDQEQPPWELYECERDDYPEHYL